MKIRLTHIPDSEDPSNFTTEREMPAVPRVGDEIEVSEYGKFAEGRGGIRVAGHSGTVRRVFWNADGSIEVRYR